MTAFPDGDGRPDCPKCRGRGVYDYTPPGAIVPGVLTCECVRDRDIRLNMERGWRGLSTAAPPDETWLSEFAHRNLWLTAESRVLRRHFHRICYEQGPYWRFQVSSDADMMDAWLSNIGNAELYDADVNLLRQRGEQVSNRYAALVDLVEPPSLLVLCVSVKAARNSAMPEVLLEALQHRHHLDKPTWVVDVPSKPLGPHHIAYDEYVGDFISDWPHFGLEDDEPGGPELPSAEDIVAGAGGSPKKPGLVRPPGMGDAAWARRQAEQEGL
jgi:hypothetical protein